MDNETKELFLKYLPLELVCEIESYLYFHYIDENGTWYQYYVINKRIFLHSLNDKPAVVHKKGGREWWENGKRHRDNKPAILAQNKRYWYTQGTLIKRESGRNNRLSYFSPSVANYIAMMKISNIPLTCADIINYRYRDCEKISKRKRDRLKFSLCRHYIWRDRYILKGNHIIGENPEDIASVLTIKDLKMLLRLKVYEEEKIEEAITHKEFY